MNPPFILWRRKDVYKRQALTSVSLAVPVQNLMIAVSVGLSLIHI